MLTDLLGYYRRNLNGMNHYEVKKSLREMKEIVRLMEKKAYTKTKRGAS